jgi:hypothetical protein
MNPAVPGAVLLEEPVTDGTLSVNFFNGRLLAAEDLQREQRAARTAHLRLGQAIGDGVVRGLEVTEAAGVSTRERPVLTIEPGLAVNHDGLTLELPARINLALARGDTAADATPAVPSDGFQPCDAPGPGAFLRQHGVYLLAVGPAAEGRGRAPVNGLGNGLASCNTDVLVEGVRFHLRHLNLPEELLRDEAHLRNRLAHEFFGTRDPRRQALERDPFGAPGEPYGLLDDLRRPDCLPDDQVPLAVLSWTTSAGIRFVDRWSVRRRPVRPAATTAWPAVAGDRRLAEGEAIFLQFQEELDDIRLEVPPEALAASTRFALLPAAGLLPLVGAGFRGFAYRQFFAGVPFAGPVVVEGVHVQGLFRESFRYPPIDLGSGEMVRLYLVRENAQRSSSGRSGPRTHLVFASGHLRYRADARYDLAHYSYGNYAAIG